MLIASTPRLSAFSACRTATALWMTLTPASLKCGRWGAGLAPAVSTIFTPEAMIASRYSSYGTGLTVGRIVRLTPNGLSVSDWVRAISAASASGVGWVRAVRKPSPPASATAAMSSALPTAVMPPHTTGCCTPKVSVNRVFNTVPNLPPDPQSAGRDPAHRIDPRKLRPIWRLARTYARADRHIGRSSFARVDAVGNYSRGAPELSPGGRQLDAEDCAHLGSDSEFGCVLRVYGDGGGGLAELYGA